MDSGLRRAFHRALRFLLEKRGVEEGEREKRCKVWCKNLKDTEDNAGGQHQCDEGIVCKGFCFALFFFALKPGFSQSSTLLKTLKIIRIFFSTPKNFFFTRPSEQGCF